MTSLKSPNVRQGSQLHLGSLSSFKLAAACEDYMRQRTSTYAHRCVRYDAVIDKLLEMGISANHVLLDLGGGAGEFGTRLIRRVPGVWYTNIDGRFGDNLETWTPRQEPHFMVAIEVLEHLKRWQRLSRIMRHHSRIGAVITTPNPATTDVLAMDHTHISPLSASDLTSVGWLVEERSHFGQDRDSLLGYYHRMEKAA